MSDQEDKARRDGWVDKDEWIEQGGEAEDWIDARQFNRNGEMMKRIRSQSRQLETLNSKNDQLSKEVQALVDVHRKFMKRERDQTLAQLNDAKTKAMEEGDFSAVTKIDDQISEVRNINVEDEDARNDNRSQAGGNFDQARAERALQNFVDDNPWFNEDQAMRAAADGVALSLRNEGYGQDPEEFFDELSRRVTSMFRGTSRTKPKNDDDGDNGTEDNKSRARTPGVSEPSRNTSANRRTSKKISSKDLPEEFKIIGNRLVANGDFKSLDEYAQHAAESGMLD